MVKRDYSLDVLKIIACFGVVTVNRDAGIFNQVFYYFGTVSIPIFFTVNGALLLNKYSISYTYCFKKIIRILKISLLWSTAYALLYTVVNRDFSLFFKDVFGCFLQKGRYGIFWFFGALIIIYLILPLIHKIYKSLKYQRIILFILLFLCIVSHLISVLQSLHGDKILLSKITQTFRLWIYLFYFYLGGLLYNRKQKYKNCKIRNFVILAFVILCITAMFGYIISNHLLNDSAAEFLYDSPVVIILVSLLFVFAVSTEFSWKRIETVSLTTMGIYIIHHHFIWRIIDLFNIQNSIFCIFVPFIVFAVSFLVCYLMLKNKYLKKLILL